MAIRKVALLGHPVLRQKARPVSDREIRSAEFQRLVDDMIETLHDYEGVGLAAPQVYEPYRLILVEVPGEEDGFPLTVCFNPEILEASEEIVLGWEGCLSIPDLRGQVPRHYRIRVRAKDRRARPFEVDVRGFPARVFQHEIDHLDGVVFLDRMENLQTLAYLREHERYWIGNA
ncbi:MAG: peptide deformylase [Candidatus Poribacteria bacterium]|nr:MAG: peptide deformylase [Candidatus Poribacteria bacterium]